MKYRILFHERKMEIAISTGLVFRYYGELMYIIFDKPYCVLHFTGNTKYRVEATMQYVWDKLPDGMFLKCKRSAILNIFYCREFKKIPRLLIMEDGMEIKLSQRNVSDFKYMTGNFGLSNTFKPPCGGCYNCIIEKCEKKCDFYL